MSGAAYKGIYKYLVYFGVPSSIYLYYAYIYFPRLIKHEAELAREYCPSQVRDFLKCKQKNLYECEREMKHLHNCLHKFKGFNQEDKDLL